jgi:hypothetical protein
MVLPLLWKTNQLSFVPERGSADTVRKVSLFFPSYGFVRKHVFQHWFTAHMQVGLDWKRDARILKQPDLSQEKMGEVIVCPAGQLVPCEINKWPEEPNNKHILLWKASSFNQITNAP